MENFLFKRLFLNYSLLTTQHAPTQTPFNQPAIAIVTHIQTQHTLTAQPAQPLTAPHTHVPSCTCTCTFSMCRTHNWCASCAVMLCMCLERCILQLSSAGLVVFPQPVPGCCWPWAWVLLGNLSAAITPRQDVRCVGVRGEAWPVLLSPCNTPRLVHPCAHVSCVFGVTWRKQHRPGIASSNNTTQEY